MIRTPYAAVLTLVLAACSGGNGERDLQSVVVIGEEAGRPFGPELSPDGTRLAYAMPVNGRSTIHVASADGSEPVQLTHGVWDDVPVWSPDGRWIAYQGESPNFDVLVVPSDGGEARQLTSGPANDLPVGWLPDGSGVVFYRRGVGDVQTLVAPVDGDPIRTIVPAAGGNQFIAMSPDGTKVAFDVHRGGQGTIWVQDLAGGAARQLTTEGLENASTRHMWSPDSRSVLYVSRRTGTWDVWVADVETGDLRQLTNDVRNDDQPRWSPDGQWVVFISDRGGQSDVWIVPAAGGAARRVTRDLAVEISPQWTADGRSIVYNRLEQTVELRVIPVDGGAERVLAGFEGYRLGGAVLSPDGRTVLFTSDRSGNQDIWSVPFDGGEPAPLAASPLDDQSPQFSPDGSTVVFVSNRAGSADLWMMPATGGEARQLTDWPSSEGEPRWSPDGSTIAFVSDRDTSQSELWIISAGGGQATRLTTNNAGAGDPRWAADGRAILYVGSAPGGGEEAYRVSVSGGSPRALGVGRGGGLGSFHLSPDGAQVAYSSFLGGWAYVEAAPAGGGAPRRLTTAAENVFHSAVRWSPDGTRLVVSHYDYAHDSYDLQIVTWPEGAWRSLTETPDPLEFPEDWTPDGQQLIYSWGRYSSRIMTVSVASLLGESASQ